MDSGLKEYLMRLGLTEYQAKAMLALYSRNDSTAKDISDLAEIPYTKIYEILDALELKGMVTFTPGKPKVYRPLKPNAFIDSLISKQEGLVKTLKDIKKDNLSALNELQSDGESYQKDRQKVRMVNSKEGVWNLIRDIALNVKEEFLIAANEDVWYESYMDSEAMLAWYDAVIERKVIIKEIMPTSINFNRLLETGVQSGWALQRDWVSYLGSENLLQRTLSASLVPSCTAIKDKEEVIIGMIVPGVSYSGLIISDKTSVEDTTRYFDMLWQKSEPIKDEIVGTAKEFVKSLKAGQKLKATGNVVKHGVKRRVKSK
ncbi:MAG: helix-turn-helix domain-containing protein [archaeon]